MRTLHQLLKSQKWRDLLFLLFAMIKGFGGTLPNHQTFTTSWWLVLAMNIIAIPIVWLVIHHLAPAVGNTMGTALAFTIISAVPLAIVALIVRRIIVPIIQRLLRYIRLIIHRQQEPEFARFYSIATLFSISKTPYLLFPITHTLLE